MTTEQDLVHAVYIKQANKLKNDVKKEWINYSDNGSQVKDKVFYDALDKFGIILDGKAKKYVRDRWSVDNNMVNFKEALASVSVNLDLDDPMKGKWILRTSKPSKKKDSSGLSVYSYAMTDALSKKSKRTDIDKIIEEQQSEINRVK